MNKLRIEFKKKLKIYLKISFNPSHILILPNHHLEFDNLWIIT